MIAEVGGYTGFFLGYSIMAFNKAFSFVGVTRVYPIHEK